VFALVVDGHVLGHVFNGTEESKKKFLSVGTRCKTVICARVTPLQKALVVRLVRNAMKNSITLDIGDGANDVSMIQEAHVGVGIMGKAGTQAVRAADYAFGEFKFLQRLLTVHGRFNYLRMANLILFSFYKNFVFITIQWYFGFLNDWSGQVNF
jgi:phospholipid-transporting ATPase